MRKPSAKMFIILYKLLRGYLAARRIIREVQPSVVVGTGGYVSLPVLLAAQRLHIPTIIHEQNVIPGLANRILGRRVNAVAATFDETAKHFPSAKKVIVTGLPVRKSMQAKSRGEVKDFGLEPARTTILIFGGSLGAKSLNDMGIGLYDLWRERDDIQVLHLSGHRDFEMMKMRLDEMRQDMDHLVYKLLPFSSEIWQAYNIADLAICRAGASTIAELTVAGLPSILVPYPFATDDHQSYNAKAMVDAGASLMIDDLDLTAELINEKVMVILRTQGLLAQMASFALGLGKPDAADKLASLVRDIMENTQEDV